jgi:hypothetical protein
MTMIDFDHQSSFSRKTKLMEKTVRKSRQHRQSGDARGSLSALTRSPSLLTTQKKQSVSHRLQLVAAALRQCHWGQMGRTGSNSVARHKLGRERVPCCVVAKRGRTTLIGTG